MFTLINKKVAGKTALKYVIVFALAFSLGVGPAVPVSAQTTTTQDLQTQIQSLLATIAALQSQIAAIQAQGQAGGQISGVPTTFRFLRNLTFGSVGEDVRILQKVLNANASTQVSTFGAGAPGQESIFFGPRTRAAVIKFQNLYMVEILAPIGLSQGTGFVGPLTRAKLNALVTGSLGGTGGPDIPGPVTTPGTGTTTPGVSTLMITAPAQPSPTLAPEGAARVPFTRFTLTAGMSGSVTVNSFTVQRQGLANDAVFDGIVLLDENGSQIGLARTLNANHQAVIGETVTIPAGQSRTFTIAGNMDSNLDAYQGQVASLALISVNGSGGALLSGSLPIVGATHVVNATLAIGTATVRVGTLGTSAVTHDIGTQRNTFSSIIISAGSNEDIRLRSIRWNQSGSASRDDLANVEVVVDGTAYPATASSDGRYYTATFGSGIIISQGLSKEVTVRADVVSGARRTVAFDIDRATDIHLTGERFLYGVTPTPQSTATAADATAEFTTGSPFFDAAVMTISGGALSFSKAGSVQAQNIGIQVPNQVLSGFTASVDGEAVTAQNLTFDITVTRSSGSTASADDIDNITLVAENGAVVAGPSDATGATTTGSVTFSGSVTFPTGDRVYTVRGQLGSDFRNGDVVTVSFEPATDVTSIRGDISGNSVIATPSVTVAGNPMTVRGTNIRVSVAPTPAAQTVVAGAQDFEFARLQLDASASGEDIRFNSIPVILTQSANPENLTGCQLFDIGTTATTTTSASSALNSGSNTVNPPSTHASGGTLTFSLDQGVVVPKGVVKVLSLRCDVSGSASTGATYSFGLSTAPTVIGVQSARTITADVSAAVGQTMTVSTGGSLTVTASPGTPSYDLAVAGTSEVLGILRFRASNEAVDINQIGLQLSGVTATSSPANVTQVTLWDGSMQVGTAIFTGVSRSATSTLTSDFIVPKDGERDLTVRANLADIGTGLSGTEGALIAVDYDGDNPTATRGVGLASGSTVTATTLTDTSFPGVRVFNTVPTVARENLETTVLTNGEQTLMRFRITADAADTAGLHKLTLRFSTTTATLTNVNVFAYTNSGFSTPVSGVTTGGQLSAANQAPDSNGVVEIYAQNSGGSDNPLQIPAGGSRWFEVRGTATGVTTGSAVTTTLEGDASYPSLSTLMGTAAEIDATVQDDFIWSPNATTTASVSDRDWTNGFGVPGLPANGLTQTVAR